MSKTATHVSKLVVAAVALFAALGVASIGVAGDDAHWGAPTLADSHWGSAPAATVLNDSHWG